MDVSGIAPVFKILPRAASARYKSRDSFDDFFRCTRQHPFQEPTMSLAQAMLAEFEHEAKTTRKFLERVPADKLGWKPHEKSNSIGELAFHIAQVPKNVLKIAANDQAPLPDFNKGFPRPQALDEILQAHDEGVAYVRAELPKVDDARMDNIWSGLVDGKPVVSMPRKAFFRFIMLNHWIHHRGQLGVYLRLLGAKVPSSYGPSGDEAV
jgi:uncharacterized damage-inducible protein DinB